MTLLHALSGRSILVVEDDYHIASDLAFQLSSANIDVIGPVANVDNALKLIGSKPDLAGAVLDIRLGDGDVFPVADELKRLGLPYVFATGFEPDLVPARHADRMLLRKPVEADAIVAAISEALNGASVSIEQAIKNKLLDRLPKHSLEMMLPKLRQIALPRSAVLEQPHQLVAKVYFPINCVASLIVVGREGSRIETGLVGCEGMTGAGLADGDTYSPYELVTQVEGDALVMGASDFISLSAMIPELRILAVRFFRSLAVQVSYTAIANARFEIRQRLARWLVMVHDRIPGQSFQLTHDYLAIMLGVRRSSVTDALHLLEGDKLIRSTRNNIEIRDRAGLIEVAGEAFGTPEAEYERLMALPVTADPAPVTGSRIAAVN